jgi:hypothetical protein
MFANKAQICVEVRLAAMRSLETKFEVLPGVKCAGQDMAGRGVGGWSDILVVERGMRLEGMGSEGGVGCVIMKV